MYFTVPSASTAAFSSGSRLTGLCTHKLPSDSLTIAPLPLTSMPSQAKGLSAPHTFSECFVRTRPAEPRQVGSALKVKTVTEATEASKNHRGEHATFFIGESAELLSVDKSLLQTGSHADLQLDRRKQILTCNTVPGSTPGMQPRDQSSFDTHTEVRLYTGLLLCVVL